MWPSSQSQSQRSTRRGPANNASATAPSWVQAANEVLLWTMPDPSAIDHRRAQRHAGCESNAPVSLFHGRASALFQMMNLRCIVPVLSLPGRLAILSCPRCSHCSHCPHSSSGRHAPWFPGALRRRACACSAWQTRTAWGPQLQSNSTLALEHSQRTLRLQRIGGHFGRRDYDKLRLFAAPMRQDRLTTSLARIIGMESLDPAIINCNSNTLFIHSSGSVSDSGSICPSVVFRAANHRDLEATCCWLAAALSAPAAAAEEWNRWRLIHARQVHPASSSKHRRTCPFGTCLFTDAGTLDRRATHLEYKIPGRSLAVSSVRACVQAWIRIGMSIDNAFPE